MPRDLQTIVDELAQMLGSVATLEDKEFNLVAYSSQGSDVDPVRQQSIFRRTSSEDVRFWFEQFGIATARGPVRTPADPADGTVARLCLPARWRGVNYGYLWFLDEDGAIDDALLPAAMSIAAQAGAALAQQWHARQDIQSNVEALLSPSPDVAEHAADELEFRNVIRRGAPVVAVVCDVGPSGRGSHPVNAWRLPPHILVSAAIEGVISVVVPLRQVDDVSPGIDAASRIREVAGENPNRAHDAVAIGVGRARQDLRRIRESWQEARLAATMARKEPRFSPVARWDELGVHRLLACGPRTALEEAVLDPAVVRLLEHGSEDLIRTAETFLDCAGNVQRAADALQVHRQTLYYRLKRIQEVSKLDLTSGLDRLVLHLGLTLAGALDRMPPHGSTPVAVAKPDAGIVETAGQPPTAGR